MLRLAEANGVKRQDFLNHHIGFELAPDWVQRVRRLHGKGWSGLINKHGTDVSGLLQQQLPQPLHFVHASIRVIDVHATVVVEDDDDAWLEREHVLGETVACVLRGVAADAGVVDAEARADALQRFAHALRIDFLHRARPERRASK